METSSKTCFKCGMRKVLFEFYRHAGMADGYLNKCKECAKADVRERYYGPANATIKSYDAARAKTEKGKERRKNYAQSPNGKEVMARYRRTPACRKVVAKAVRAWQRRHPEAWRAARAAAQSIRRASQLSATPDWLTPEQRREMKAFYSEAAERTRKTGVPHEVDHIVPLQGKGVRGLHVPWNLQVITAKDNLKKGNK